MCMLSDVDIKNCMVSKDIILVDSKGDSVLDFTTKLGQDGTYFQSHGYDLRIGAVRRWGAKEWDPLVNKIYMLKPGEFLAIETYERIKLSRKIAATIHSRARKTLVGLVHISTTVHPGWGEAEGKPQSLIVAVNNISRKPIRLSKMDPFCRLTFYEMKTQGEAPAPKQETIKADFELIWNTEANNYLVRSRLFGWFWLIVSTIITGGILWNAQTYYPNYGAIAVAFVIPIYSLAIAAIRRRFSLFQ